MKHRMIAPVPPIARTIILAIILGCTLVPSAWADDKKDLVRELLTLMEMESQFEQWQVHMQGVFDSMATGVQMTEEERVISDSFHARAMALTQEELGWSTLEPVIVELYATYFTEQEIIDMIEFQRSPTGQRMIEATPMIMEEATLFTQEAMLRLMPRLEALAEEWRAEMAEYRQRGESVE